MITENEDMIKAADHLIDVNRLVGKTIDPSLALVHRTIQTAPR